MPAASTAGETNTPAQLLEAQTAGPQAGAGLAWRLSGSKLRGKYKCFSLGVTLTHGYFPVDF